MSVWDWVLWVFAWCLRLGLWLLVLFVAWLFLREWWQRWRYRRGLGREGS